MRRRPTRAIKAVTEIVRIVDRECGVSLHKVREMISSIERNGTLHSSRKECNKERNVSNGQKMRYTKKIESVSLLTCLCISRQCSTVDVLQAMGVQAGIRPKLSCTSH